MAKQNRRLPKKIAAPAAIPAPKEKLLPKPLLGLPAHVLETSLVVFLTVLAAAGIGSGFFFLYQYKQATGQVLSATNQQATPTAILQAVSRLLVVPDETPSVATVTDITKLAGQPFFAPAQNGDKVLIFQNAKEAVLYRPSVDKIVEVAPLVVASPTPTIPVLSLSPTVGAAKRHDTTPTPEK